MQSNTTKTKKTRKVADNSAKLNPESASPIAEENAAPRTKSAAPAGSPIDGSSPVKKHRRVTKAIAPAPGPVVPATETGSLLAPLSNTDVTETGVQAPPSASQYSVSHEEIAKRAYLYWVERGYAHGDHLQDWLRAENELSAQ